MHQLVYVSTASWAMSNADLNEILDASRRNNRVNGVTGMLLHIDRGFLQVLEGPKAAVEETYARIKQDRKHNAPRILVEQETDGRLFGDWSMGFDRIDQGQARTTDVFAITRDAIENAITPEKAAHLAILLRNFYRVNAGTLAA
ncbi:MAG: BLUF domain-containing protein [Rhizomicrobium sp.]|jgi:hypothetical protein